MKLTITILFIFLAAVSCKKDIYSGITFNAPVFPDSASVQATILNDSIYTNMSDIAVIIPAYKEAENLKVLLPQFSDVFINENFEILIFDLITSEY